MLGSGQEHSVQPALSINLHNSTWTKSRTKFQYIRSSDLSHQTKAQSRASTSAGSPRWEGGPTKRPVEIHHHTVRGQPSLGRAHGCESSPEKFGVAWGSLAVANLQFLYLRRLSCPFRRARERRVAPANSGTSSRLTTLPLPLLCSSLMRAVEIFPRCSSGASSHIFSGLFVPVVSLLKENLAPLCRTSKVSWCNTASGEVDSHRQKHYLLDSRTFSKMLLNAAVVSRCKKIAAHKVASSVA